MSETADDIANQITQICEDFRAKKIDQYTYTTKVQELARKGILAATSKSDKMKFGFVLESIGLVEKARQVPAQAMAKFGQFAARFKK